MTFARGVNSGELVSGNYELQLMSDIDRQQYHPENDVIFHQIDPKLMLIWYSSFRLIQSVPCQGGQDSKLFSPNKPQLALPV